MVKFNMGDRIRVKGIDSQSSRKHHGEKCTVISKPKNNSRENGDGKTIYFYLIDCECYQRNGIKGACGIWEYEMTKLKEHPLSEIDYLDSIKQNFEDGI